MTVRRGTEEKWSAKRVGATGRNWSVASQRMGGTVGPILGGSLKRRPRLGYIVIVGNV